MTLGTITKQGRVSSGRLDARLVESPRVASGRIHIPGHVTIFHSRAGWLLVDFQASRV